MVFPRAIVLSVLVLLGAGQLPDAVQADRAAHSEQPAGSTSGQPPEAPSSDEPAEVVVFLKDGQIVNGILVEATGTKLILRIGGIPTTFPSSLVDRYRILPPILERYEDMRRAAGDDAEQIVRLAEWLAAREKYELALIEAQRAASIDPNNTDARNLVVRLSKQLELKLKAGKPQEAPSPQAAEEPRSTPPRPRDFPVLTDAQVNTIKVYEINLSQPIGLVIKRETITRLLDRFAGSPLVPVTQEAREGIYRKSEKEILELMFRLQARDFYPEVKVLGQPESMRLFRDEVHAKWLVNRCATNACHGGEEAGRLMLCNRRPNSDASIYTNFLILDRYRMADGTPLINYDNPERSPLLQLGLPREDSLFKHPVVARSNPGARVDRDMWSPVFHSRDERQFLQAEEWIRTMYRPHQDYPVDYRPPGASVAAASKPGSDGSTGGGGKPEPVQR